ncbi:hypothetical protein KF840_05440 [bacterium]|nr:hypothetical protein [bacterium]
MTMRATILTAAVMAMAAGCAASGPIAARLVRPDSGAPVAMAYRSQRFTNNGTLTATLPDGERFSGPYLQVTSDVSGEALDPYWGGWGVGWDGWTPWSDDYGPWIAGADMPTFIRNYSGKVIASLQGDRGGRMRCRFRLAEPDQGMSGGGLGECETGSGERISATF